MKTSVEFADERSTCVNIKQILFHKNLYFMMLVLIN